jgi:hypothetical protein
LSKKKTNSLILVERIEPRILFIRGQRIILDADLADLYGVTTKRLNEQVKRNANRFPPEFMFQFTKEEVLSMRSQFATASDDDHSGIRSQIVTASKRNIRYLPYAFTEHGALMAASILNTPRAIDVSVYVIKAFVKLREFLSSHKDLAEKLASLERKVSSHDESIQALVAAIRRLLEVPSTSPTRRIGFHVKMKNSDK